MNHSSALAPHIRFLLQPSSYPHPVDEVTLVQTHISQVLLAGEYVYKFKKPVNFGFLDFSDLDKRRFYCEQELLLNRRLCPDIYLGLVRLSCGQNGAFALDGPGSVVEYGIRMKRMPEERMMAKLMARGELNDTHMDALVRRLAAFYEKAERSSAIDAFGSAQAVGLNVCENFEQTRGLIGQGALDAPAFEAITSYAQHFLQQEHLFQQRIDAGRIRDCHGDLYSANICLADNIYIYDCIEFNQRFRYCDVASDVAFLAMDLDVHGLQRLSNHFIKTFIDTTDDAQLMRMLNFYKCYRAYVRGKIGLFTASDAAVDQSTRRQCVEQAKRYFQLALQYAQA